MFGLRISGFKIGIGLILILFTLLAFPWLKNSFVTNLGWVYLMREYPAWDAQPSGRAEEWFAQAEFTDNSRYWFGYGAAALQLHHVDVAWERWQQGQVPYQMLAAIGGSYVVLLDDWQTMLNYYIGADQQAALVGGQTAYMGSLCQSVRTDTRKYFGESARYCDTFTELNKDNLLVNGNFALGATTGWNFFPSPPLTGLRVEIETSADYPMAIMKLVSAASYPNSVKLCQRLDLEPGEFVEFRADIQVDADASSTATIHPLYIGWRQNNSPGGNASRLIPSSTWNTYSRTFQLPDEANPSVLFCPIDVTGAATIWLADVRLITIAGNDDH